MCADGEGFRCEKESQEVPIEFQDMWNYMEEFSTSENNALIEKKAGTSS